jgi:Glucanosyltransferase
MRSLISVGVVLFSAVVRASLNPIIVKGNGFFDSVTNSRFYIRGVDYQVFEAFRDVLTCVARWLLCCQLRSSSVISGALCRIETDLTGMSQIVT